MQISLVFKLAMWIYITDQQKQLGLKMALSKIA